MKEIMQEIEQEDIYISITKVKGGYYINSNNGTQVIVEYCDVQDFIRDTFNNVSGV